jgi:N-methylhydantoinase A
LADALRLQQALVPVHAGVLSALGMLASRPGRQLSRTWLGLLDELDASAIDRHLEELADEGRQALVGEGIDAQRIETAYSLDLRYRGQSYTLNLAWRGDCATATADFAERHAQRYGHRLALPVELVNLRVSAHAPAQPFELSQGASHSSSEPPQPTRQARVYGIEHAVPVYRRADLPVGCCVQGPAVIAEAVATTWLASAWRARVDAFGNLLLSRHKASGYGLSA